MTHDNSTGDKNTYMINVTFNECNFSSEDDNLEVPDEIDYSKIY